MGWSPLLAQWETVCTLSISLITNNSNAQTKILKTTPRNSEAPDRLSEELRRLTNMQNLYYLLLQLLFPRLLRLAGAVNTKQLLQPEVLQWKQKGKGVGAVSQKEEWRGTRDSKSDTDIWEDQAGWGWERLIASLKKQNTHTLLRPSFHKFNNSIWNGPEMENDEVRCLSVTTGKLNWAIVETRKSLHKTCHQCAEDVISCNQKPSSNARLWSGFN